jgi:hypothetical protein
MKDNSGGGGGLNNIFQQLGSRLSSLNSSPRNEERDDTVIEEHDAIFSGSNDSKGDR